MNWHSNSVSGRVLVEAILKLVIFPRGQTVNASMVMYFSNHSYHHDYHNMVLSTAKAIVWGSKRKLVPLSLQGLR